MQRLFTMFPEGWPGAGVLILSLMAAIPLLVEGRSELWTSRQGPVYASFIAIGVGILLLVGLWTPVAGALQVVIDLWAIFAQAGPVAMHVWLAALGASLVMLGPGALSVDALLFGRKRIEIDGS